MCVYILTYIYKVKHTYTVNRFYKAIIVHNEYLGVNLNELIATLFLFLRYACI